MTLRLKALRSLRWNQKSRKGRYESPLDREKREQREWEQTSNDPVARHHREWEGRSAMELLEAMAQKEEEDGRWCRLSRSEGDLAYELYSAGLIAETRSYNVTELTDKGRRIARHARIERREVTDPVVCRDCGHGFLEHRSLYPSSGEQDARTGASADAWKENHHCRYEGCHCTHFFFEHTQLAEGVFG